MTPRRSNFPPGLPFLPAPGAQPPRTSLVIVSRHRPAQLALCLRAVMLSDHPQAEVIVIADPAALASLPDDLPIKRVAFDQANISAARNLGLAQAAGDVVAFVDDDAIPEPDWLRRLGMPFVDARVVAAGGVVRGRDGMGWQFRAGWADASGITTRLPPPPVITLYPPGPDGAALSTIGTNCAFRRDALVASGGFRAHHRYHLDETDVNLRLAAAGGWSAVVPDAQVIHGAAESVRRTSERVTTDLTEIGASSAAFWRVHAPGRDPADWAGALIAAQRRRLIAQMLVGTIEPPQIAPVLATLTTGLAEGARRPLDPGTTFPPAPPFQPIPVQPRPRQVIAGRRWNEARLRDQARTAVAQGAIVTLMLFSRTTLPHRQRFHPDGYWEQTGGLWGASHPDLPRPWHSRFAARRLREIALLPAGRRPEPQG